jgi:hypothetical protein
MLVVEASTPRSSGVVLESLVAASGTKSTALALASAADSSVMA